MQVSLRRSGFLIAAVLCLLILSGCGPVKCIDTSGSAGCVRVLFIGNSYTFVNDLPGTFARLAGSGDHLVEAGMFAEGGWSLSDQIKSHEMFDVLQSSNWDYVIVQEQSQIPALEESRNFSMYPAARVLIDDIRQTGATPVFFETWAHQNGWPENGMPDFETMQYQVDQGYLMIARELQVPLAPVGDAWFAVHARDPDLKLWQEDGSHPTEEGTYLAACVFYAVVFQESPQGLPYTGNLTRETADLLQTTAARVVLKIP